MTAFELAVLDEFELLVFLFIKYVIIYPTPLFT